MSGASASAQHGRSNVVATQVPPTDQLSSRSISRFLCLAGLSLRLSMVRLGGGEPNRMRARRLTSLDARKVLSFRRMRPRPQALWGIRRENLAEVCRNRTDRPDRIGTAGFEVPGGHQPTCTSALILLYLESAVIPDRRTPPRSRWRLESTPQ